MATTEKMLPPGLMPGKEELDVYNELFKDQNFTLKDRINSFNSSVLPEEYVLAFCKRYPSYTLVGDDSWKDDPLKHRYDLMKIGHRLDMEELGRREASFRARKDEKSYKSLRAAFSTAIGTKVCVDYLEAQCSTFTPEELTRQVIEYKEAEKKRHEEWEEEQKAREKIIQIAEDDADFLTDLDYYNLNEKELKVLEEMLEEEPLYIPDGYIKEYNSRRGEYVIPIMSVKFRMIRKELKINQRSFAKRIGYPNVNKYALLEQGKLDELGLTIYDAFPIELIKSVVDATYANPYWLEREDEESLYDIDENKTATTVEEAREWMMPMFAEAIVIRYWWSHR